MKIPITKTHLGEEEVQAVRERLLNGWVVQGPKVKEFEDVWSAYTGARHSKATTSCTTALHLALLSLGIGPGDEVIVPSFTWVATANAVEYCGATPIFADIEVETFNIDVARIPEKITSRTKVIMPVHEFGLSADMNPILAIAKEYKLRVVEDGACACGTQYFGKHVGSFGDIGCFSFHPRKAITTGEGGMLTTSSEEINTQFEILRSHGAEVSDLARHNSSSAFILPEFNRLGFNYRMTDIQAAIGVEQMKKLPWVLERRRARAQRYSDFLSSMPGIRPPTEGAGFTHVYQSYVTFIEGGRAERDRIGNELEEHGIATRQGTHAVHMLNYYRNKYNLKREDCPKAWMADQQSLTLPLYATMTDEEQEYVIQHLKNALLRA